jgi:hypothetical protein
MHLIRLYLHERGLNYRRAVERDSAFARRASLDLYVEDICAQS